VIDCYTKAIIGWAMDDNYKTPLIEEAIRMATRNYTTTRSPLKQYSIPTVAAITHPASSPQHWPPSVSGNP
jgi:hypothetical protein